MGGIIPNIGELAYFSASRWVDGIEEEGKKIIVAVSEELRHGVLLSHNVCFKQNNEEKNQIHIYPAAHVKVKEWELEGGHFILTACDIVIYVKKYISGLCPLFWNRAPKTLGYLLHPGRAS